VFEFKNITEAKPKYCHSVIQGTASALWCEVLGCFSRGGLPSLFLVLRLTTGPHPFAAAVVKLRHVCTQIKSTSKAWATKAQQEWPINVAINSRLLACEAELGQALYYIKLTLRVSPYIQVLALLNIFPLLVFITQLYSNHYTKSCQLN
jgi:hypothetical protein